MKPETKFRNNQVLPFLKKLKNTTRFPIQQIAIVGDPDYLLCIHGRFVALELKKSNDDDPRKLQAHKLNEVTRTGGLSLKADPQNWASIKQILSTMDSDKGAAWLRTNDSSTP